MEGMEKAMSQDTPIWKLKMRQVKLQRVMSLNREMLAICQEVEKTPKPANKEAPIPPDVRWALERLIELSERQGRLLEESECLWKTTKIKP